MTKSQQKINWLKVALLCLAGGTIFLMPYLRYGYYDVMLTTMGLNNTQLGAIMAAYGVMALPSYLIGGMLADRFSARNLLIFSFMGTGLGGFYLMTKPPYLGILIVHLFWGFTTVLTFWAAFYKTVRLSADEESQGKIFGLVNGGRRIVAMVVSSIGLWIFSLFADQQAGFSAVLAFLSSVLIALAILYLLTWKADKAAEDDGGDKPLSWADIKDVLRLPTTWLLAGSIFGVYGIYRFGDYFTPYMTQGLGMGVVLAGFIGTVKSYGITPLGAIASGFLADKVGRVRFCMIVVATSVVCKLAFIIMPVGATVMIVANIMLFMIAVYGAYTLIYSVLADAGIPKRLTGTVIGVASCIGFVSEVTTPIIAGWALDNYEGMAGFKLIFVISAVHGMIALIFYALLARNIKRRAKAQGVSEVA